MAASVALSACAKAPAVDCLAGAQDEPLLASQGYADRVVNFVRTTSAAGQPGAVIEVVSYRRGSDCAAEHVDTYHYEGGEPTLEASFTHTVRGEPNLFAIVSWSIWHAGLDTKGRMYSVYAYHDVDGTLVLNDLVVKNRQLQGGFEGTLEGEPSGFEGTTQPGVVAMLERLGLE